MFELNAIYTPITALPNAKSNAYTELAPCLALRPYIRCFWGTVCQMKSCEIPGRPIIPDTCMDIIFRVNYTQNTYTGKFCTLDERFYHSRVVNTGDRIGVFGIRFYAWSAVLFSDCPIYHENPIEIDNIFRGLKKEFEPIIFDFTSLRDQIAAAEKILIKRLDTNKLNYNMMNALYFMIHNNGNIKMSDLSCYTGLSNRTLERMFKGNMGISPKTLQTLIRYQLLWQDIYVHRHFDVFGALLKYGYFDQAHLLNDFKQKHAMTPNQALDFSLR